MRALKVGIQGAFPIDVRPLFTACPSGCHRAAVRPGRHAAAQTALQHRTDAASTGRTSRRGPKARTGAAALGVDSVVVEGPSDRRANDQRTRRIGGSEALVPKCLPAPALPFAGGRLLRMEARRRAQAALFSPACIR